MFKRQSADPRDPNRVTPYKAKDVSQYEDQVDYYPLGAMLVSVLGVMMKSRFWCCASLILAVASLTTLKRSTTDFKQIILTIMFTIFAMFSTYMVPEPLVKIEGEVDTV